MTQTTETTVTPAATGSETAPVVPASVATPVVTETVPVATSSEIAPVAPPAEASSEASPATGTASEVAVEKAVEPGAETVETVSDVTAPAYTDFTFPEGAKVDAELVGQAKEAFGKYGLTQEAAQELINLHTSSAQKVLEAYQTQANDYWAGKSREWVAEVENDPRIGGNRLNTSLELARGVWNEVIPDKAQRDRLFGDLTDTKIGDHPVLARALTEVGHRFQQVLQLTGTATWADAMKKLREPASPPSGREARGNGASRPADRRYSQRTQQ